MFPTYVDPLDTAAVRAFVRAGLQDTLDHMNARLRQDYEGALFNWKGEAERAAGLRKPLPAKPQPPARLVLGPDGEKPFEVLTGPPIEFTDVEIAVPYDEGFFPPGDFIGKDRWSGDVLYNAHPGCQYPDGFVFTDSRGKFLKVRTPFNAGGGGHWVKIG